LLKVTWSTARCHAVRGQGATWCSSIRPARLLRNEARRLSTASCSSGHHEGIDGRVRDHLSGRDPRHRRLRPHGREIAALAVVDAVARLCSGVLNPESPVHESFRNGLLSTHYTRPATYRDWSVPEVSTRHREGGQWRKRAVWPSPDDPAGSALPKNDFDRGPLAATFRRLSDREMTSIPPSRRTSSAPTRAKIDFRSHTVRHNPHRGEAKEPNAGVPGHGHRDPPGQHRTSQVGR
jgi:hypothetical protein